MVSVRIPRESKPEVQYSNFVDHILPQPLGAPPLANATQYLERKQMRLMALTKSCFIIATKQPKLLPNGQIQSGSSDYTFHVCIPLTMISSIAIAQDSAHHFALHIDGVNAAESMARGETDRPVFTVLQSARRSEILFAIQSGYKQAKIDEMEGAANAGDIDPIPYTSTDKNKLGELLKTVVQ